MTIQSRVTLWVLFFAMLVLMGILWNYAPPEGWLAFEFPAWTGVDPAAWSIDVREGVFFSLGLDFLFIFVYASWFTVLGRSIGARVPAMDVCRNCLPKLTLWIWAAAAADALENWGLHRWLREGEGWLLTISILAAIKWLFVTLVAILLVAGWLRAKKHERAARETAAGRRETT